MAESIRRLHSALRSYKPSALQNKKFQTKRRSKSLKHSK